MTRIVSINANQALLTGPQDESLIHKAFAEADDDGIISKTEIDQFYHGSQYRQLTTDELASLDTIFGMRVTNNEGGYHGFYQQLWLL
ncbi:MAG: hypothetical protein ACD_62C00043G0003 [uncultured bacterium]|nr:MAG: hypothetical protein ACD_62C00043G0003 [uncultured bacterium]HLD45303.1 hypothetical protein [bacterium]